MEEEEMNTNGIFSSATDEWPTPPEVFSELDREFSFTLDPCSTHENAKCEKHYTKEEDGLQKSWGGALRFYESTIRQTDWEVGAESV